jgi:hypothetical protein
MIEKDKSERAEVLRAEEAAYAKLDLGSKVGVWFADGRITQAKAARRRYWKNMDHVPWAKLFKAQNYNEVELRKIMVHEWKMPGYFQKRIRAEMEQL